MGVCYSSNNKKPITGTIKGDQKYKKKSSQPSSINQENSTNIIAPNIENPSENNITQNKIKNEPQIENNQKEIIPKIPEENNVPIKQENSIKEL